MKRDLRDHLLRIWVYGTGVIVLLIVFGIFGYIFYRGAGVISPQFIFGLPEGTPLGTEGGILPALIGSLLLGLYAGLFGGLLGICTAIYLVFYCKRMQIRQIVFLSLQSLAGIPSVVLGLFGYSFFIIRFGMDRCLLSASLTLGIMIIPFVAIRVEKNLQESGKELLIHSLGLGVSKSYALVRMILPNRLVEILASLTLGMAYAMGATAPIMYTGAVIYTRLSASLTKPVMALPYHLYILVNEGISMEMAYGTAFVLMVLLLLINGACQSIGLLGGRIR